MKKTVLIVEDDSRIAHLIEDYFTDEFRVITADNGAQALISFDSESIDLIILDVMLPVLDSWEVLRAIRSRSQVPIIILTAKTDEESNLKGFALGVDDYVPKPFSPKILLAKARAVFKRLDNTLGKQEGIYEFGPDFIINAPSCKVMVDGEALSLSATEFAILLLLVRNKDIVLTRDTILDKVWGENFFGDPRIVDTNIRRIRDKLGRRFDVIYTVRGIGYKFEVK